MSLLYLMHTRMQYYSLQITYFGLITQKTGEDWKDAKIFLSTAQPSVGGEVPELPAQTVNFERVPAYRTSK